MEADTGGTKSNLWAQSRIGPRLTWIEVMTVVVQFYCILCHCVFLMVVVLWMFLKEVVRRLHALCRLWADKLKTHRPELVAWLASRRAVLQPPPVPTPVQVATQLDAPEADVSKAQVHDDPVQQTPSQEAPSNVEAETKESPVSDLSRTLLSLADSPCPASETNELRSLTSLVTVDQVQSQPKRLPCSISAVVEDKYARGMETSTSSSTLSLDAIDVTSDEEEPPAFEEKSKSSEEKTKSNGTSTSPNSWKLGFPFQKASRQKNARERNSGSRPSSQDTPPEKKFSLAPVITHIKRGCCRAISAINRELTECVTSQSQKTRKKKTSQGRGAKKGEGPSKESKESSAESHKFQEVIHDLSVPEVQESAQSSWIDGSSTGGTRAIPSSLSGSLGEMQRGLLDSFSESGSAEFAQRRTNSGQGRKSASFEADIMESFTQSNMDNGHWNGTERESKGYFVETGRTDVVKSLDNVFKSNEAPTWKF